MTDRPVADREPLMDSQEKERGGEVLAALQRLIAVVDAGSIVWRDPVPADAMAAIHNAKEVAARHPDEARLRARIEALPEMVGEPNDGGWSLVRRSDVLAALAQPALPVAGAEECMSPESHDEWMSDHRACGCDGQPEPDPRNAFRVVTDILEDMFGPRAGMDWERAAGSFDMLLRHHGYTILAALSRTSPDLDVETVRAALTVMDETYGSGWSETGYLTPEQRAADLLAAVILVRLRAGDLATLRAAQPEDDGLARSGVDDVGEALTGLVEACDRADIEDRLPDGVARALAIVHGFVPPEATTQPERRDP